MTDVYQRDPNRILVSHAVGDLQAWKPEEGDVSICITLNARVTHKGATPSWVQFTQYMTIQEARSLAAALVRGVVKKCQILGELLRRFEIAGHDDPDRRGMYAR